MVARKGNMLVNLIRRNKERIEGSNDGWMEGLNKWIGKIVEMTFACCYVVKFCCIRKNMIINKKES
jgi:hypothetical protein